MPIPLSTTTITVLRPTAADLDDEPYAGTAAPDVVATGVPAVIDRPTGREQLAGGEQSIGDFNLACDECDIKRFDTVRDDATGIEYRVVWLFRFVGEHVEAGLRLVEGET